VNLLLIRRKPGRVVPTSRPLIGQGERGGGRTGSESVVPSAGWNLFARNTADKRGARVNMGVGKKGGGGIYTIHLMMGVRVGRGDGGLLSSAGISGTVWVKSNIPI